MQSYPQMSLMIIEFYYFLNLFLNNLLTIIMIFFLKYNDYFHLVVLSEIHFYLQPIYLTYFIWSFNHDKILQTSTNFHFDGLAI